MLRGVPCGTSCFESVVDKHYSMADEAVLADVYQLTNKTVGLNPAPTSDIRFPLNFNERPYKTVVADGAAVQVDRAHNRNIVTKGDIHDSAVLERHQSDPLRTVVR